MNDEGKKKSMLSRFTESLFEEADKYLQKGLGSKAVQKGKAFKSGGKLILDGDKLGREVRIEIEKAGEELKKFLEIAESLREIIPEEGKRYTAAVKALASASGYTKDDVIRGADKQLAELKRQRDNFARFIAKKKEELKAQSAKGKDIREQIAFLRENIKRLDEEDKRITSDVSAETIKISAAEESFGAVVDDIEAEIAGIKGSLVAYLSGEILEESPRKAAGAATAFRSGVAEVEETDVEGLEEIGDLTDKIEERIEQKTPAGGETKTGGAKVCPVCHNKMEWYEMSKMWRCFVCGEEEN